MDGERIVIRRPDDMHVHLREGAALALYAAEARDLFGRILVMPNTNPPILSARELTSYRALIEKAAPGLGTLMTFKIRGDTPASTVRGLKEAGAAAGKLYPRGATTNSDDGLSEIEGAYSVFEEMEKLGITLCIHGEEPAAPALEREEAFLPHLEAIIRRFPGLKIVLEHVSSRAGVEAVLASPPNVAATVTVHHLLYTIDELLGGRLNPHFFCRPLIKGEEDRKAIQQVVLDGNRRFFFGSDSAPHPRGDKERGAAGVYSMPVSLPLLAEFFAARAAVDRFEDFVSRFGAEFYGVPLNEGTVVLRREGFAVPEELHGVVPLAAGRELPWRVAATAVDTDRGRG